MWLEIGKVARKLIVLVLPFFVVLPVYCWRFPYFYMDQEYAMYRQQREYVLENGDYNRVIVLGDSRAKAGFLPEELSESTYNLSLGGMCPIEGYYSLCEYLENHQKPKALVLAYAPMHYMDVDTLWTRTVYFHNMERGDFFEILDTAKGFEKSENILVDNYGVEYLMYALYMPNKYAEALKKAGFVGRYQANVAKYGEMEASKGHTYYGMDEYSDGINGEAHKDDFVVSDVIDFYVRKTLDLCREQKIKVMVEQLPMNEMSYGILQEDFKENYKLYMSGLAVDYPEAVVTMKPYCYGNEFFGDADHLNERGSKEFSHYIKEKYPVVFKEPSS